MISTVTVEEDALKQTETGAQDEHSLVQSPNLIGNHYVYNRVSSKCSSGLYFKNNLFSLSCLLILKTEGTLNIILFHYRIEETKLMGSALCISQISLNIFF